MKKINLENKVNKFTILANKQRQLGNICIFGYDETCKEYDNEDFKCEQGGYNHCLIYQNILLDMQIKYGKQRS